MKKEIKFRGRDKDGNWVFGNLIHGVAEKEGNLYILPYARTLAGTPILTISTRTLLINLCEAFQ